MTTAAPAYLARQHAAADPAASVWVGASAGTGKTKVLTDRVLRLLLDGTAPGRILCLTFTRAAAAQMESRIAQRLGVWATAGDADLDRDLAERLGGTVDAERRARARSLFARVIDAPVNLRISTIHAFCESLLKRFPLEAGIAPHFQVMDERSAAEARAEAVAQVLAGIARDGGDLASALDNVTAVLDEGTFAGLVEALAGDRARLRAALGADGVDALAARIHAALGVAPGTTRESLEAERLAPADEAALRRAAAVLARGSDAEQGRAARLEAFLAGETAARAATVEDYLGLFLTKEGKPLADRNLATKKSQDADPGVLGTLQAEAARLADLRDRINAFDSATASTGLVRVVVAVLAAYDRVKADRQALDYADLILEAGRLLGDRAAAPWVMWKLDGGIDHILVDEAQDTSPEQWRVIAALAEEFFAGSGARGPGRTVFVVGDEKQSIFSFQGADVAELRRLRAHLATRVAAAGEIWRPVALDHSFRSAPAVLAAVDAVFAQPAAARGVVDGATLRHQAHRAGAGGRVELWPPVPAPEKETAGEPWDPPAAAAARLDSEARLAGYLVRRIHRWILDGEWLEARGRPVRPGDFLVLVQRRTALVERLVRGLKERRVPVAGVDRLVLTAQLAVMDLLALGRFLLLPEDDLTLAEVLKGPLFGFDDDALFTLAHGRGKATLWSRLQAAEPGAGAVAELRGLLAVADVVSPHALYARLLGADGGRRRILARLGPEAGDPLDEFLALALDYERIEPPSLRGFLHWVAAGTTEIKRDTEHGRDEVRVMTVHGAKGLEAPIVILADALRQPSDKSRLVWAADAAGPIPFLKRRKDLEPATLRTLRDAQRARAMDEYRRLLYVAMTRAEDRLYVTGWEAERSGGDDCWHGLVRDGLGTAAGTERLDFDGPSLWPEQGWAGDVVRLATPQVGPTEPSQAVEPPEAVEPMPAALGEALPVPPAARALVPSAHREEDPPARSPVAPGSAARFARGRLVHTLLQALPELPPAERAAAAARFLVQPAHRLPSGEAAALAREVMAILDDAALAPLFGPGSRAEVAIAGRIGETVILGQVDRLLVAPEAVLIVDYKTLRPAPATVGAVAPAYLRQLAAYRAVLRRVYPDRRVAAALVWTDTPRLMAIPDDALDPYAP